MRVLIIGAGGHAQVVADILLRARDQSESLQLLGYLDDDSRLQGRRFLGMPVLGTIAQASTIGHDGLIVAVGDNETRQRLFRKLEHQGEQLILAQHPGAIIAPDVEIGSGSVVCAGGIVNPTSLIGANVILNTGCTVDHHNHIGDHAHIGPGVHTGGEVTIGEGALIGIGATIMPGRHVGCWSVVGAGAVVVDDIPAGVTAMGVPARVVGGLEK